MKRLLETAAAALLLAAAAHAEDLQAGAALAQSSCSACHGVDGRGIADQYPNLAGQKAAYMVAQLRAFRDGDRSNPIMSPMAKPLSEKQMANVSAYYASLGCDDSTDAE